MSAPFALDWRARRPYRDFHPRFWRALDELAIATYYVGKRSESRALNERLLAEGHLPDADRQRILANLEFAKNA